MVPIQSDQNFPDQHDETNFIVPKSYQHHSNEDSSSFLQIKPTTHHSCPLLLATIHTSISALLFGYQQGTAGALQSL
jgi:hypothetical protein